MTTRKSRDSQRSKLYRAENEAFPEYKLGGSSLRPEGALGSITECSIFIGRVLANPKAREAARKAAFVFAMQDDTKTIYDLYRWPSRVTVEPSYGKSGATAWGSSLIRVSTYYRNRLVLLHELAHLVAPSDARHGPVYAAHYLALVRVIMGVRAHDRLRDSFKKHRVRYKPKRALSPERRAVLVERLARVRAKSPIHMTDEQYADHMAAKNGGADNIDDPRVARFVMAQQAARGHEPIDRSAAGHGADDGSTHPNVQRAGSPALQSSLSTALALANSDTSYT